jgi:hypothetical protein
MHKFFNLYFKFFYVQKCIKKAWMYKFLIRGKNIWLARDMSFDFFFFKKIGVDNMMQLKTIRDHSDSAWDLTTLPGRLTWLVRPATRGLFFSILFFCFYFFYKLMLVFICFFFKKLFIFRLILFLFYFCLESLLEMTIIF